ncbi:MULTISPECIES: alpha/beta hydrolase [Streptomyces]|uniref:alpha/beta hydrolase n=1 Tax=Streptomyces TaxID=1883 RepID=UPI00068F4318|nr:MULTISPECIES: alpha/beta hydrolase [Streptomyces]
MDIKTLYDANVINITIAKNAFDTLYSAFGRHIESWQHEVADRLTNSHWTGTASDHAQARIRFLGTELQSAHSELDLVGKALAKAAEQFALAQSHLVYALDDAKAAKLNVAPDGTITWDKEPTSANYAGAGAETTAIAISNPITAALNEAAHADQELSARLSHFATNASNGTGLDAATVAQDLAAQTGREQIPPAGTEPASVKKWWDGLTDTERQKFIHEHPDQIGNLDGVPAAVRDQANRVNLRNLIKDRETQLANLGPEPTRYLSVAETNGGPVENPDYTEWKRKHDALQEKLTGFQSIQKRLDGKFDDGGGPNSDPPLLLLGIGDQGQGRAILSWGDPDKAKNVSSLVPGLNSTLAGVGAGDASTAKRIYQSATTAATANGDVPPSVASVFWLGYDAPQLEGSGSSVLMQDRAEEGGAAYNKFLHGLRATHEGAPAHMTAQGHSYGSLVVGKATQQPVGLPVDDIVLVGSPGVGVDKATQLGIGADHVYVGTAKYDPVADAPAPGMLIPGWAAVEAITNPDGSWHGTDPASESFGGQRFSVADGTVTDSHDNYFGKHDKGGDSLPNIGKIVSGHGNTITREDPR